MPIAGPIAALVLKFGLDGRFRAARSLAIGSSIPDGLYAYLAFWGVTSLLQRYPTADQASQALAAVILIGLGIHFMRMTPVAESTGPKDDLDRGVKRSFLLGFTISATNPTLIATWTASVAVVNGSGLVRLSQAQAWIFGIGAGLGMICWLLIMIALMKRYSSRLRGGLPRQLIRATGGVLVLVGLAFAWRFAAHWA